jgi:hypothetical protein
MRKQQRFFNELVSVVNLFPGTRVGFIIEALGRMAGNKAILPHVHEFVKSYVDDDVKVVARKARRTLKKLTTS